MTTSSRRWWYRRKTRKDYKKRLDGVVPREPREWEDVIEDLPVIEI